MKVAVVLSGHLRCWETVFPNFKERVIDRYNPDIFIHTWSDAGYWVPQEGRLGVHENSPPLDAPKAYEAYKPLKMVVETFTEYEPFFAKRVIPFTNYFHRPRNIVSMFHKMGAAFNLLEEYVTLTGTKYDLVIRMRPDMILHQDLPEFDPATTFYTLAHRNHKGGGTGDMFQIGNFKDVGTFCRIGTDIEELYQETGLLCPHVISQHFIRTRIQSNHAEFDIQKTIQHTPRGPYQAV